MSTINNRVSRLATNETTKAAGTRLNINVTIDVEKKLPIVVVNDAFLTKRTMRTATNAVLTPATTLYTLSEDYISGVDVNGVDIIAERFVYIGYVDSFITNNSLRFYYDNKYKDVIIIPNTELSVVDETVMIGQTINLIGHSIGSDNNDNNRLYSELLSVVVNKIPGLPMFNSNIPMGTSVINLHGVQQGSDSSINGVGQTMNADFYIERYGNVQTTLITLGTATSALVIPTDPLPLYSMYQYDNKNNTAKYLGWKKVPVTTKIGIILDF